MNDSELAEAAVARPNNFFASLFVDLLDRVFDRLGVQGYPSFPSEESLTAFREQVMQEWSDSIDAHARAAKPWGRALDELYALENAKNPSEERIKAKESELAELRAVKDEKFAVLLNARRAEECARSMVSAFRCLGNDCGDAGYKALLRALLLTESWTPGFPPVRAILTERFG